MGQVTLYLDSETEARMKEAAKARVGAWADMPTAEELRQNPGEDVPREPF